MKILVVAGNSIKFRYGERTNIYLKLYEKQKIVFCLTSEFYSIYFWIWMREKNVVESSFILSDFRNLEMWCIHRWTIYVIHVFAVGWIHVNQEQTTKLYYYSRKKNVEQNWIEFNAQREIDSFKYTIYS